MRETQRELGAYHLAIASGAIVGGAKVVLDVAGGNALMDLRAGLREHRRSGERQSHIEGSVKIERGREVSTEKNHEEVVLISTKNERGGTPGQE